METNTERRRRKRRQNIRKRRIIIPIVFFAVLFVFGQLYEYYKSDLLNGDAGIVSSVAAQTSAGSAAATSTSALTDSADNAGEPVQIEFYAGDDFDQTKTIKPGDNKKLPRPKKEGYHFNGWYTERVGGDKITVDNTFDLRDGDTLYARWEKTSPGEDTSVPGIPVLMYHWFYDTAKGDPVPSSLLNNWIEASVFEEEMRWLKSADYYFPSWDEMYAYIKGEIDLPRKSIVITIDDGRKSFYEYAIPILEMNEVKGTGFVIASKTPAKKIKKYSSDFISIGSHTWNMHDGHGGDGLIELLPYDEAVTDLTSAAAILETKDVLAYPFGYYDDNAVNVCSGAGIRMAFGVNPGSVYPGSDPLRLPRVRISSTIPADTFKYNFPE